MMERMGQVIAGRFELVAPIARGGQGTVWLAEDRRTGRRCAAKVLDQADSASLLRFVREQGVQVDHAYLASPYGWAAEDHEVAIAMPLVAGGSLEGALADWGALGEPLTAALLMQLLDGLAELHGSGWIHRDVKPANVLLDATGTGAPHLRLGDMGLAMRADDPRLTSLGHLHGTPGYVPPEAYRDEAPDPAQDLFAAGVTGLRMLDPGCRPQDAGAVERVLGQVEDAELKAVLTGLVAEDPAARIRAAAEAPRRLAGLARPEPSGVRPDDGLRLEGTSRLPVGYLTASGETFEVFDQLEGLDEDRGAGPEEVAGPEEDTEDVPPVAETTVITAPDHVEASAPAGAPGASGVPGVAGTAASRPVAPAAEAPAAETPGADRSRLLAWALVGAGALALIAALVLLLGGGGGGDPAGRASSGTGTSAPSESGAAASPAPGTSSAEPPDGSGEPSSDGGELSSSEEASTAPSTGYPSPDAPATPRSAGRPALTSSVRAGQDCIPAEHGTEVIGMDEQHLMCTWAEGAYSWTVVED